MLVGYSWTNWGQTETNWIQDEDLKYLSSVAYLASFLYACSPAVIHHDLFLKVGISVQKTCTWKEQQVLGDKDKKADYHDYDYYDRDRHRYQHFYNHNKRLGVRGCCYQGDKKIGSGEKVR